MRLQTLLLVVAALACCVGRAPDLPPALISRQTVAIGELARWEQDAGPLRQCTAELASLTWIDAPGEEVSERCHSSRALAGCFTYEPPEPVTPTIRIADDVNERPADRQYQVWRHELTHWLLVCSDVDRWGDPEHLGPWWDGLL